MADFRPSRAGEMGRSATKAALVETIDERQPETKAALADAMDLSPNYVSELLRELKADDVVSKAYVVDERNVYRNAGDLSPLWDRSDDSAAPSGDDLLDLLARLDEVAFDQYRAAAAAIDGESRDPNANQLEGLANERYSAVLSEVKEYTISTPWPGGRIASALAAIAKNLEIAGDRACFVEDAVEVSDRTPSGTVHDRVLDIVAEGETVHGHVAAVLFDAEVERVEALHAVERDVHRDLAELFELTTAYDEASYGYMVGVAHALERILHHWVNTAETATRLHVGLDAGHVEI